MRTLRLLPALLLAALLAVTACSDGPAAEGPPASDTTATAAACDPDDGGITLPEGFCARVVAEGVGPARHMAVAPDGDIYVKTRSEEGGIAALRDTTGDHRADVVRRFGDFGGTGIAIHDGSLYASSTQAVYRWPLPDTSGEALVPEGEPEVVVGGFPEQGSHASKSFAFDESGHLYVNVGAPSNACQEEDREAGSPGMDPCPLLEGYAGIWRFDADETGQTYAPGARYATGIRNVVGLDWNAASGALYVMQHGRDQLHQNWPDLYTEEESAALPAEELLRLTEGADAGWPYCYYDGQQDEKVLAPEYGGDGEEVGRCDQYLDPVAAFPGHWAPNGLLFYTGEQFPERYRGGVFIAFHGSWNRAPLPQRGYKVSFVPFEGGTVAGDYEPFADGFAGVDPIPSPAAAEYRPMGLAQGPDGALYIVESREGRIWRVVYTGEGE